MGFRITIRFNFRRKFIRNSLGPYCYLSIIVSIHIINRLRSSLIKMHCWCLFSFSHWTVLFCSNCHSMVLNYCSGGNLMHKYDPNSLLACLNRKLYWWCIHWNSCSPIMDELHVMCLWKYIVTCCSYYWKYMRMEFGRLHYYD